MPTTFVPTYQLIDRDLTHQADRETGYVLRIRDMPAEDKPREKLVSQGPGALSVSELVAILLGVGNKNEDVLHMAERILREYGEKAIIHETNPIKLANSLGITVTKASRVIAGLELGRRFYSQRSGRAVYVRNAKQAYQYLKGMGTLKKEQFRGLYLNSRYQVIHDEVISVGSLTANIVHPREVFYPALEHGAVAVILAHNHPSGNPAASQADIEVTEQLMAAGQLLGIDLLDHLVITANNYKSMIKE